MEMDIIESGLSSLSLNNTNSGCKMESSGTTDEKIPAAAAEQQVIVEERSSIRHCAFCLKVVPSKEIMKCGKCKKRAYCTKECQVNDWSLKNGGQGHKNWCHIECGEEDVDWEVVPVEGKGLGLIAKRLLPAMYRIMVEAPQQKDHPKIMELMPSNGSLEEKFNANCLWCGEGKKGVGLRIARANHACDPNAAINYDETLKVQILFTEREIGPGEEIYVSYTWFKNISIYSPSSSVVSEGSRLKLEGLWGITCPDNCICRDQEYLTLLADTRALHAQIFRTDYSYMSLEELGASFDLMKELLHKQALLRCGYSSRAKLLFAAYQLAPVMLTRIKEMSMSELQRVKRDAVEYILEAYEIECAITCPNSKDALNYLSLCQRAGLQMQGGAAPSNPLSVVDNNNNNNNEPLKKESSDESTSSKRTAEVEGVVESTTTTAIRHCAFCLHSVPLKNVKKCSGCHKRAYCSKECQVKDWTLKEHGSQGHKNWCALECGEEDIDWEVVPVEGKGLGIVAKRLLPARYRIMVDPPRPITHPKIMELMQPLNGTLEQKYDENCLWSGKSPLGFGLPAGGGEYKAVFLRIGRVNHNCDHNAANNFDETLKVKVAFAERDIAPGEEICFSYTNCKDISHYMSREASRYILQRKWGIICTDNCFCRNPETNALIDEARDTHKYLFDSNNQLLDQSDFGLLAVKDLLQKQASNPCLAGLRVQVKLLYAAYQILTSMMKTKVARTAVYGKNEPTCLNDPSRNFSIQQIRKERKEFIKQAYEIEASIRCPNSKDALKYLDCCKEAGVTFN